MSHQSPDSDTAAIHNFMDFVYDREREAVRWTFDDPARRLPCDYVEFYSNEIDTSDREFRAFPPMGEFRDDYEKLSELVKDYRHDERVYGYAAHMLVAELEALRQRGVMIPAGQRRAAATGLVD